MKVLSEDVKKIVNEKIRPRTKVDGGDVRFNRVEEGIVYVDAYADCAVCRCCDPELTYWIKTQVKKELDAEVEVRIVKHKPYYA